MREVLVQRFFPGNRAVLEGLLLYDGSATKAWILREIGNDKVAILGISVEYALDVETRGLVFEAVSAIITERQQHDDPLLEGLLHALWTGSHPYLQRLKILATLGREVENHSVPAVLKAVGRAIRSEQQQVLTDAESISPVDEDLLRGLIQIISRLDDDVSIGLDRDSGYGIAALVLLSPAWVAKSFCRSYWFSCWICSKRLGKASSGAS